MSKENPGQFFNQYFSPEFASQFIATSKKRMKRGESSDKAISYALENTDLKLPPLVVDWKSFDGFMGTKSGESLCDVLEHAVKDCKGDKRYAGKLFSLADSDLSLRMEASDFQQQVIQNIMASLPKNLPASQLSHLVSTLMVPVGPIRLMPDINIAASRKGDVLDGLGDVSKKLLAFIKVVLFAIGIEALFDLIVGDAAIMKVFVKLWQAVLKRDLALIGTLLEELLGLICGKQFRKMLAKKLGKKAAAKLIGRVLAKLIPFVGWALLIASIIYAVYQHWDELVDP